MEYFPPVRQGQTVPDELKAVAAKAGQAGLLRQPAPLVGDYFITDKMAGLAKWNPKEGQC